MENKIAVIGHSAKFDKLISCLDSESRKSLILVNYTDTFLYGFRFSSILYLSGFRELPNINEIIYNVKLRII